MTEYDIMSMVGAAWGLYLFFNYKRVGRDAKESWTSLGRKSTLSVTDVQRLFRWGGLTLVLLAAYMIAVSHL